MTEQDPASIGKDPASTQNDPWDFSEFGEQSTGSSALPGAGSVSGGPGIPQSAGGTEHLTTSTSAGAQNGPFTFDRSAGSTASAAGLSVAHPPLTWLGASAAAAVIGLLLAALLGALPPLAVIGWVLAGPVAIGALAVYTSADTRRRARPIYVAPNWLAGAYYACLGVCLIGVVIAAIRIALWVGRW